MIKRGVCSKNNSFFVFFFFCLFFIFPVIGNAETLVGNETALKQALTNSGNDEIKVTDNFTLNSTINVVGNKSIDLQGNTLTLKEGTNDTTTGKFILNRSDNQQFSLKNGTLVGGDTRGLAYHSYNIGVISVGTQASSQLVTTVQDISHTGKGGFYKGKGSKIVFKGKVILENAEFNVRAKNMDFYGNGNDSLDPENTDFSGHTWNTGEPNDWSQGSGGLNLSFDGYETFTGSNQRILNINKNAKVKLKNDNNTTSNSRAYANNIANFAVMNIHGTLDAEAVGTSLRTTASRSNTGGSGTLSGQAEINVFPGSVFKILSTATTNTQYGTIFTYSLDINIDNPENFDIRFFGTGQFFYSWTNRNGSNFNVNNSDIGVWSKSSKGIGNPVNIWQGVEWMKIAGFTNTGNPKATSSNTDLASKFTVNNYSRITNDVTLPMIIPDEKFKDNDSKYFANNGDDRFYGTTDYYYPDGSLVGKKAPGATLSLYLGNTLKATTIVDKDGNWSFDNFESKRYAAGNYTLKLTDTDKRTAKDVPVELRDTLAPIVTTKLYKFQVGNMNALKNPRADSINSINDETSSSSNHEVVYDISEEDRVKIISNAGFYEVNVKVKDEAGNAAIVAAPVIVYEGTVAPTNGFVSGNDFEVPYDEWNDADDFGKRGIVTNHSYGNAKGYTISGNTVTEVTDDATKFLISYTTPTGGWKPGESYPVTIKVGTYSKVISMKLGKKDVAVSINQVYSGTTNQIYSDLSNQTKLEKIKAVGTIGNSLNALIDKLIDEKKLIINYTGYDIINKYDYKIVVDGKIVNTNIIPDKDFEIVYSYNGQLRFEKVPSLNFGEFEVSSGAVSHKLDTSSQSEVEIINTLQGKNWQLKVSLPKGIKKVGTDEQFLGELIYIDKKGKQTVIDSASKQIEEQDSGTDLTSTVDVKGDSKSGMRLNQELGNSQGKYKGELTWSIEDVVKP